MSDHGAADMTKAASVVAGKLSYDFHDLSNLETAFRLPDRSDENDREADDGNRPLARIGREATRLAASIDAQKNGESREIASLANDSQRARDDRLDAAKRMGLSELLVRSPRQSKTEVSWRVLDRSLFAIAGAVCIDSDGDISSVSQSMRDIVRPDSSRQPRSRSLPASSVQRKADSSSSQLSRTASLQQRQQAAFPELERYIWREAEICRKWVVPDPVEGLRTLEGPTVTGESLSDKDKVKQRLLYFAFGSQEAVLWLYDAVRQYSGGSYRYVGLGCDTRAHFERIQQLSAQSAFLILLRRFHTYLFFQSLDEAVRRPLRDFLPTDGSRPGRPGNPRNLAQKELVNTIMTGCFPQSSSDEERVALRARVTSVCKQALNLDRIVQQWGLGALVLFKGSSSPAYSNCELNVSDDFLGGIAFETFRVMVTNLNAVKGSLFCSIASMFQPLVEEILQGQQLQLGLPLENRFKFLTVPRDVPGYAEHVRNMVLS